MPCAASSACRPAPHIRARAHARRKNRQTRAAADCKCCWLRTAERHETSRNEVLTVVVPDGPVGLKVRSAHFVLLGALCAKHALRCASLPVCARGRGGGGLCARACTSPLCAHVYYFHLAEGLAVGRRACCLLHAACCMLHAACCVSHAACFMLHAAWCVSHAACCMLHAACCMLRVQLVNLPDGRLAVGRVVPRSAVLYCR